MPRKRLSSGQILSPTAALAYARGLLFYDSDNECLSFYNNDSQISLQVGQEVWVRVRNMTGSTIPNGTPVYINGENSGWPTVAPAKADLSSTVVGIGLTTEDIATNSPGMVTVIGEVRGLNTSSFTAGQTVYVSETTAGALTTTAPVAPYWRYRVGKVTVSNATTGRIHVTPSTADLGNGTANQLVGFSSASPPAKEVKTLSSAANVVVHTAGNIALRIPSDFMLVQVGNVARAVGSGDFTVGHYVGRAFTATSITYQFDTADASGSTTVELRRNGTQVTSSNLAVTAANQADGTGTDAARTATINQAFNAGDRINLQITAVGTTPGKGLRAWIVGYWN